jgi:cyclopropane-fatty-acyl-phospholipid synthase
MWYTPLLEKDLIPDQLIRWGIRNNCKKRIKNETVNDLELQHEKFMVFVRKLKQKPIAEDTKAANEQHYELPTRFFQLVLGKHLKYSCGYWKDGVDDIAKSEEDMLEVTCNRADLVNGQYILECGCGWGSLSLFMAGKYPNSKITAVSNSRTQKIFIDEQAKLRGFTNLTVITADMNTFSTEQKFDRIVSVEMFEHMRNYEHLMARLSGFLNDQGKMFIHIFTHRYLSYLYEVKDESDWMSKYFFTGGIMPSDHLLLYFADHFKIENHWRVNGKHYSKTSEAWLRNMDNNKEEIMALFADTYGKDQTTKWWVYWRIFFMACSELWNYNNGNEWFVSHYLFEKRARPVSQKIILKENLQELWNQ